MPIIKLQDDDIILGLVFLVLQRSREELPLDCIYLSVRGLAADWLEVVPRWRGRVRRVLRFLASKDIINEVEKGHWKMRGVN